MSDEVRANYNPATGKMEYEPVHHAATMPRKSLIARIDSFNTPPPPPQKTYYKDLQLSGVGWYPQSSNGGDLGRTDYGAAQAFTVVTEVQRAVVFWGKWLSGLTWQIKDARSDEVVIQSTDRYPQSPRGSAFYGAVKRFQSYWKHDFFESIAFSDWVYGETYLYRAGNGFRHTDYMWLNPLVTEPQIMQGKIGWYSYSGEGGYLHLEAQDVAFRIANRNPFDDLRGQSPILSAIDKINVDRNVYRALLSYYRNNMTLGGIVSPASDTTISTGASVFKQLEDEMRRGLQGVDKSFHWFFANERVEVEQFTEQDISKNFQIIDPLRRQIAQAMGVPPMLSGDPTEVNYDNADKVWDNWVETDGRPYAKSVAEDLVNTELLPYIEPDRDLYFCFDFTDYDVLNPEQVTQDFNAGYIPINVAQEARGYDVDKDLENIHIIGGRPMHKDIIKQLAYTFPAAEASGYAQTIQLVTQATQAQAPAAQPALPAFAEPAPAAPPNELLHDNGHNHDHDTALPYAALFGADKFYPDEDELQARMQRELDAWYHYEKVRYGKANKRDFEPHVLEPFLYYRIWERMDTAADFNGLKSALLDIWQDESIKTKLTYRRAMRRLAQQLHDGTIGNAAYLQEANALVETEYNRAVARGLQAGEMSADDLTPNERAEIDSLIFAEQTYLPDLMVAIANHPQDAVLDPIRTRLELWISRIDRMEDIGYTIARADYKLMWVRNKRKASCGDCLRYDGRVYRGATWHSYDITPRSPRLECFGTFCGCKFVETDLPITRGRPPAPHKYMPPFRATWDEDKHPRDESGQFGSGGGGGSADAETEKPEEEKPAEQPAADSPSSDTQAPKPKRPKKPKPDTNTEISDTPPAWASNTERTAALDSEGYLDHGNMRGNALNAAGENHAKDVSWSHTENLDRAHQDEATRYTGEAYRQINGGLRGNRELSEEDAATVAHLDRAISQNSLSQPSILYRGMTANPDIIARMKPGATFSDSAYTSTSFDQNIATSFAGGDGAVMRIRAPKGQPGLAVSTISDYSEEHEVVLPRNTRYRVNSIARDPKTNLMYIDAEIAND